jgi:hypothetical protein
MLVRNDASMLLSFERPASVGGGAEAIEIASAHTH